MEKKNKDKDYVSYDVAGLLKEKKCSTVDKETRLPHEIVFAEAARKKDKQLELDKRYLRMAFIWAENSYAIRRKVGALVVKDKMIISDGYNGTPSGFENVCEDVVTDYGSYTHLDTLEEALECKKQGYELVTKPCVLHAEANAITKLAKSHNSSEGATLYVTDEPCMSCSKLIIQAGIVRVVYCREYHDHSGIDLLKQAKIEIWQIKPDALKE